MTYSKHVMDECFSYFTQGKTFTWIANNYKESPPSRTLSEWCKMGDWRARKKEIVKKSDDIIGENLADLKARQRSIAKATVLKYVQHMKDGQLEFTKVDPEKMMKLELLLAGEVTDRIESNVLTNESFVEAWKQAKKKKRGKKK